MPIMEDSLPNIKTFLRGAAGSDSTRLLLIRFMTSILIRHGRNSCMNAASVMQGKPVHRAQPARFLQRARERLMEVLSRLVYRLLRDEDGKGEYIFIVDSTMVGQQGKTVENTFSTGNRTRRPRKGRRYSKHKRTSRSCHCFVFGLLLTPQGLRAPSFKPYYTRPYAKQKKTKHFTQAQLAAQLIYDLPLPAGTSVTVLGDTAFDAKTVRAACDQRGYLWIFPCNANRVFAGPRGQRRRVSSRINRLSEKHFQTIRLTPSSGKHLPQRRLSRHRVGSKQKQRTFYVHSEQRAVHNVGQVMLVYSSTKPIKKRPKRESTKVLMTNAMTLPPRTIVELYCLRWQIELFFKELKSVLGMHQYQFKRFDAVESWMAIVSITFVYLEWTRDRKLNDRRVCSSQRDIWRPQRSYGLRQAILVGIEIRQHLWITKRLKTKSGQQKLKKMLLQLIASEYRCAA